MLQCTFCFSFRRKEEIIMKVDDSYKHVDGSNEGNYSSQTKFERHIVFAPFLIIIMAPKRSLWDILFLLCFLLLLLLLLLSPNKVWRLIVFAPFLIIIIILPPLLLRSQFVRPNSQRLMIRSLLNFTGRWIPISWGAFRSWNFQNGCHCHGNR
jgi:hypothetical protein